MAIIYSTEGAKQNDPTAKNLLNGDEAQSSVVYGKGSRIVTTALAAGDEIRMFKIPTGYTPIVEDFLFRCPYTWGLIFHNYLSQGADMKSVIILFKLG